LQIYQARPSRLEFDMRTDGRQDGLDVTLSGDFTQLTIDLEIDGERLPDRLLIGERRESPDALPARLNVKGADPTWIQRFGF
jgi:hypothetical protein